MSSGDGKSKHRCGTIISSACVRYELDVPSGSSLNNEGCNYVENVLSDLYGITENINNNIDLTELTEDGCISYTKNSEGKVETKEVLLKHDTKLNEILQELGLCTDCESCNVEPDAANDVTRPNINISGLGLDFRCLSDECGDPIVYLKDLLQAIINKLNCT